ncbi:MAG TPA: hypothetical protein VHE30_30210 [Polyangiaceae bacterium]|nr:hypothetical protein [Polyangiaceae bacterium]
MRDLVWAVSVGAFLGLSCSSSGDGSAAHPTADAAAGGAESGSGGSASAGRDGSGGASGGASGGRASGGSGGGGAGSGNAGSGGADAGGKTDAGAADPCATALFCETFESYAEQSPPGSPWKTSTNHGAVSVATDRRFRGAKAAKFSTEANSGGKTAFIRLNDAPVFPVPNDVFYGRMMAWLDSAPETSVHWTFIQGGGLVPGQSYHALYRYGGQHPITDNGSFTGTQLMANYETPDSYGGNGPGSDCWNHADRVVFPVQQWNCVEWEFDGGSSTMRFWLNGSAVDSLTVQGVGQGCVNQPKDFAWTAPAFDALSLGWESYQNDTERTLYVDDVVLAQDRVGCPAP